MSQSKAQYLEANVSLVTNETVQQRLRIKKPIRIRIKKTSVKIVYPLHFIGVSHAYTIARYTSRDICVSHPYCRSI